MCDAEQAKVYGELAKEKFDGIWKRRQIAWRTNFVLWAGLAALSTILYREAENLPDPDETWTWALLVFALIFAMHGWHWLGAYVSDEIGYSWAHYYQQEAEVRLCALIPNTARLKHPSGDKGWCWHLWKKYKKKREILRKAHAVIPQILVTAALMAIVLFLLHGRLQAEDHAGSAEEGGTTRPAMTQPAGLGSAEHGQEE